MPYIVFEFFDMFDIRSANYNAVSKKWHYFWGSQNCTKSTRIFALNLSSFHYLMSVWYVLRSRTVFNSYSWLNWFFKRYFFWIIQAFKWYVYKISFLGFTKLYRVNKDFCSQSQVLPLWNDCLVYFGERGCLGQLFLGE